MKIEGIRFHKIFFVILISIGVVIPITWFHFGHFINTADFTNSYSPGRWLRSLMGGYSSYGSTSGGQSTIGTLPLAFPYVTFFSIFKVLSVPIGVSQIIFFQLLFCVSSIGMWGFARKLFDNHYAAFIAALVYSFNPYTLIEFATGEIIQLEGWALFPLFAMLLIDAIKNDKLSNFFWLRFAILSAFLASDAQNLAAVIGNIFLPLFLVIIYCLFSERRSLKFLTRTLKRVGLMGVTGALINLWWLFPFLSNFSALTSGYIGAPDTLNSPEMNSVLSAIDLITGWGYWGFRAEYLGNLFFPFERIYLNPFIRLIVCLPLLIIPAAFLIVTNRKLKRILFLSFLLLLAWYPLSAGWHGPTGRYFSSLFNNISLFRIFRSPWQHFAGLEWIAISLSAAVLVASSYELINNHKEIKTSLLNVLIASIVLISVFPFFGTLFNSSATTEMSQNYAPSNLPSYVNDTSDYLASVKNCRVFLPAEFYKSYMKFTWHSGSGIPVTQVLPCDVIAGDQYPVSNAESFALLVDNYISEDKPREPLIKLLQNLGFSDILIMKDQLWNYYSIGPDLKSQIRFFNESSTESKNFGMWRLYKIPSTTSNNEFTLPKNFIDKLNFQNMSLKTFQSFIFSINSGGVSINKNYRNLNLNHETTLTSFKNSSFYLNDLKGESLVVSHLTYDPNLSLRVLSESNKANLTVEPVLVNNFQMGWLLRGKGSFHLSVFYSQIIFIRVGIVLSLITLLLLFMLSIYLHLCHKQNC